MARLTSPLGVEVDVPDDLAERLKGQGYKPAGAKKPSKKAEPEPEPEAAVEPAAEEPMDTEAPKPAPSMFSK